jgi:hypothetical protein
MGVSYLPVGLPAGKYLLSKISKSGEGHHSVYSVLKIERKCSENTIILCILYKLYNMYILCILYILDVLYILFILNILS